MVSHLADGWLSCEHWSRLLATEPCCWALCLFLHTSSCNMSVTWWWSPIIFQLTKWTHWWVREVQLILSQTCTCYRAKCTPLNPKVSSQFSLYVLNFIREIVGFLDTISSYKNQKGLFQLCFQVLLPPLLPRQLLILLLLQRRLTA